MSYDFCIGLGDWLRASANEEDKEDFWRNDERSLSVNKFMRKVLARASSTKSFGCAQEKASLDIVVVHLLSSDLNPCVLTATATDLVTTELIAN